MGAERRGTCSTAAILLVLSVTATFAQQPPAAAQADHLLKEGRTEEALAFLLRLHQSQPSDWQVCHQLGIAYTQLQQLEKALEFYDKALSIHPGFASSKKNRATVLWFLGRKRESEREFLVLAKSLPKDPVPHLYLALAEYERNHFSNAKRHFGQCGDLALNNPEVLPAVLDAYLAAGDHSIDSRLLEQIGRAERPDPELVLRVGTVFIRRKMYAEAIRSLERIAPQQGVKAEVYLALAEAYERDGKPEKAYSSYAKAIELAPQSEEGYIVLANFASAHRNHDFALKILSQGLQRIPNSARLFLEQGLTYALQGRADEAEDSFRRASGVGPNWSIPLLALGVSQLERGKLYEAASSFREAAKMAPDDARAHYLYATALNRMGDPWPQTEITAAFRKAVDLNPRDAKARASLGQAYLRAGRVREGIVQLQQALEIDPDSSTALYQLARIYQTQGKAEDARRLLNRFQQVKARERQEETSAVQILKLVREK